MTHNDRSALSSFRKEFFTPIQNASQPTVGRTLCASNDNFPAFCHFSSVANFVTAYFLLKIKILAKRERELTTRFAISPNGVQWLGFFSFLLDFDLLLKSSAMSI